MLYIAYIHAYIVYCFSMFSLLYMTHTRCILVIYVFFKVVQHAITPTIITDFQSHHTVLNLLKYVVYCIACITPTAAVDLSVYY